jgi:hypothetical protein
MPKILQRTNRTTTSAPTASEISEGEIGINNYTLGTSVNGFNNGRLYIKCSDGSIKRFIGLGLPGDEDASLKTKYGGTNNNFSTATTPSVTNAKNLTFFNFDSSGDHDIQQCANNTLVWDDSTNRLSINRSSTAAATLDVNGDMKLATLPSWTTTFSSSFSVVGQYPTDEKLYRIRSDQFISYIPNNTMPPAKISGTVGISKGGTGRDFVANPPVDGSMLYFDSTGGEFAVDSDIVFDDATNTLTVNGIINNPAANDTTLAATPLGVDASNNIVKLTPTNTNNIAFSSVQVEGGALIAADTNTDTITFSAGDGITIAGDALTDTVTINASDTMGYGVDDSLLFSEFIINRAPQQNTNKYFYFDPNGANRDVFLTTSGVLEGETVYIKNDEDNSSNLCLSVYNGNTTGTLLTKLYADYGDGYTDRVECASFVHDGTNWKVLSKQYHYTPYPSVP